MQLEQREFPDTPLLIRPNTRSFDSAETPRGEVFGFAQDDRGKK